MTTKKQHLSIIKSLSKITNNCLTHLSLQSISEFGNVDNVVRQNEVHNSHDNLHLRRDAAHSVPQPPAKTEIRQKTYFWRSPFVANNDTTSKETV